MSKTFRPWQIDEPLLLPPCVQDFVGADHLARFVVGLVLDHLDLREIKGAYGSERGQPPFDPAMMTALLLYAYCNGVYSSRRIAKAARERVDFMSVVGLDAPDFRTVSDFRKRHLKALAGLFTQVLRRRARVNLAMTAAKTPSRIALVTGANRGIGLEVCRQLAPRGWRVLLGARDLARGEAAARGVGGGGVRAVALDLADPDAPARLRDDVGRVDALVNNAGVHYDTWQGALDADWPIVREAFETNLFGAWRMAQAFAPLMREAGWGRIVNVSSGAGSLASMGPERRPMRHPKRR